MRFITRARAVFAICLLFSALPSSARAQLCFDIFEDLTDPSLSCADTFYFVIDPDGDPGVQNFGDSDTGLLGAEFDGFDLFDPDDPDLAPPDNLLEPFFTSTQASFNNDAGQISDFTITQRGAINLGARDSTIQQGSYGSVSRITFIPFTTDGDTDPVILDLDFDFEFTLRDPSENTGNGSALVGGGASIFDDDPLEPLFDFSGLAALDLEFDDEPEFFGDFDGPASSFEPSGPGIDDEFDIDIEFDTTFQATPGQPLTLDTDTFGSIFTDGFESGDTSAWSASSPDTYLFTVSSSDPTVRFMFDTVAEAQDINYGHAGSWYEPETSGQGFLIDIQTSDQFMFVASFTFDTFSPQEGGNIPGAEQRWFTAQGNYSGNRAVLTINQTRNGKFDDPAPVETLPVGTVVIEFLSCTMALLTYDIPDLGLSGTIPLTKLLADEICTQIAEGGIVLAKSEKSKPATDHEQDINYGLIGAWFNPLTAGQGFLFDFLLDDNFMFVASFTFDTISPQEGGNIPGAEQRWFTAAGNYAGNRADLIIYQTRNGVFDDSAPVETLPVGTMVIEFTSCTTAVVTYDLPDLGLSGTIEITKILADEICTKINDGDIQVKR